MSKSTAQPANKQENVLYSILFNIAIPSILLMKGKAFFGWEPAVGLIVALAFPAVYFFYDYRTRGKRNFIAIVGFISILITGGVGLLQLDKDWIAVKEAAVPALFGVAVLGSLKTRFPLVRTFLFSPEIFKVEEIDRELHNRGVRGSFERLLTRCTVLLSLSFFLSAVLNYALARVIMQNPSGTDAFNEELGRMQLWSYPVIVLPTMVVTMYALFTLLKGIETHTGMKMEQVLRNPPKEK